MDRDQRTKNLPDRNRRRHHGRRNARSTNTQVRTPHYLRMSLLDAATLTSGARSDDFMFQSCGAMTSRFESLIYTEASLNSTCGRFSVFEAFRREADLIANLLAAGKMYLPDVFASLLPPGAHTLEAELTLLREANRKKLEHFVYVFLGTIHKSQEVSNTVLHRAPGLVKSVLHAKSLMPKLSAGDDTNQMDAMFVSVSSELLKKTSRASTTVANNNLTLIGSTSLQQLQESPQGIPTVTPFVANTQLPPRHQHLTHQPPLRHLYQIPQRWPRGMSYEMPEMCSGTWDHGEGTPGRVPVPPDLAPTGRTPTLKRGIPCRNHPGTQSPWKRNWHGIF